MAVFQDMLWQQAHEERATIKRKKLGFEMNAKRKELSSQQKLKIAEGRTEIAQQELKAAFQTLAAGLDNPLDFDWDKLKSYPEYPRPKPAKPAAPEPPFKPALPREPLPTDGAYQPKLEPLDKLRRAKRDEKAREARERYEAAHEKWKQVCARVTKVYQSQKLQYKQAVEQVQQQHQQQVTAWEAGREKYRQEREQCVQLVDKKKAAYLEHEANAVIDFFDMALAWAAYPSSFPHSYEMDYDAQNRLLTLDYLLPPLRVMPRLVTVVYNESTHSFHETLLSDEERNGWYAKLLHELPLRIILEMFSIDNAASLAAIQFRGYLFLSDNKKQQPKPPACVLNVQADRGVLASIDVYHADPVVVFEELGGMIRPLE